MRLAAALIFLFLQICTASAQASLAEINLVPGKFQVGFRHYTATDHSRTYHRIYEFTNKTVARPLSVSLWYPAVPTKESQKTLQVIDYLRILKEEEEWEYLPDEQILNWFHLPNTPQNQKHLGEKTLALANSDFTKGRFPLIVYTPSYQASSIENFALCEYLASHGFVVIASPSRGTDNRWFSSNSPREMETQARDVEFLLQEASKLPMVNAGKIALLGFSFGGLANIIVQNRNAKVKAIASLDGTERYQYQLLSQSPFFDADLLDVPYLHMAQKEIPGVVMQEDNIPEELNSAFALFDSLSNSLAYKLRFHDLTHSHFSTLGVLFSPRDPRQDKSDKEIMQSYKLLAMRTLQFLDASLKSDKSALPVIKNLLEDSTTKHLISCTTREPQKRIFTFLDFNELALRADYRDLPLLYDSLRREHPLLEMPESSMNTLGLQLTFNPATASQGINVLLLATQLYPDSSNLFDSLGEAYLFIGDKEKAIASFERSLELYPQNQNAASRLVQMRK